MKTLSTVTGGLAPKKASKARVGTLDVITLNKLFNKPVIWDIMTLMWRSCDSNGLWVVVQTRVVDMMDDATVQSLSIGSMFYLPAYQCTLFLRNTSLILQMITSSTPISYYYQCHIFRWVKKKIFISIATVLKWPLFLTINCCFYTRT